MTKKCLLCLHEKLEIVNYPHPEELLNKRSELEVSACEQVFSKQLQSKRLTTSAYPGEFLQFYLSITLMFKGCFLRYNTT